jgi:ATP-dependent protease ClpP protease subunit
MANHPNQGNQQEEAKSIIVSEIPEAGRVEVSIRGEILEIEEHSTEIQKIQDLSDKYSIVHVYINSPGGSLMTCIEMLNVLRGYTHKVTFAIGEASSAGFIIWSIGDIRVVDPYTILMNHRESYGNWGKTSQHLSMANVSDRIYESLYHDTVYPLLSDKEIETSLVSEVWIPATDMVERGHAITMDQYENPEIQIGTETIITTTVGSGADLKKIRFMYNPETKLYHIIKEPELSQYVVEDVNRFAYGLEEIFSLDDEDPQKADEE